MTDNDFECIIRKYENLIFTVAFQFLGDYQEAQNITQETFISLYRNIDNCNIETIKSYILKIVTNKVKDYFKSAYKRKILVGVDDEYNKNQSINSNTPEDIIIQYENRNIIKEYILNLKQPYKDVSILYFLEEKSVDEISKKLKRPKKTVQTQIFRAKKILKNYINER